MADKSQTADQKLPGTARLWAGWFVAIFAWGLHLFLSYSLVEWYCRYREILQSFPARLILNSLTGALFFLALFGGWLAWSSHRRLNDLNKHTSSISVSRSRFLANSGVLLSAFLAIIILVQGLPNLVLQPCY